MQGRDSCISNSLAEAEGGYFQRDHVKHLNTLVITAGYRADLLRTASTHSSTAGVPRPASHQVCPQSQIHAHTLPSLQEHAWAKTMQQPASSSGLDSCKRSIRQTLTRMQVTLLALRRQPEGVFA